MFWQVYHMFNPIMITLYYYFVFILEVVLSQIFDTKIIFRREQLQFMISVSISFYMWSSWHTLFICYIILIPANNLCLAKCSIIELLFRCHLNICIFIVIVSFCIYNSIRHIAMTYYTVMLF